MQYSDSMPLDPDARWEVWPPLLDFLEEKIDVPGLAPADRAALSALHDYVGQWAGVAPLVVPPELTLRDDEPDDDENDVVALFDRFQRCDERRAVGEGLELSLSKAESAVHLHSLDLTSEAERALRAAGFTTLCAVARLGRDELLELHGIGPGRADEILVAVEGLRTVLAVADNGKDGD